MKMKTKILSVIIAMFFSICLAGAPALAENLNIKGSTTVLPIAQVAAEAFMKAYPNVNISVSGGGSGNGIKALIDKMTDIADASRFIEGKEVARAVKNGVYPVPFAIAYDCITPVVHPSNPVSKITISQLHDIYVGKIRNWKQLGGHDLRIVVVSRDTSSGTYEVWEKKVLHGSRVFPGALLQASNGAVAQAVANNKYAIGYVGLSYLNKELKALPVNGVLASQQTAASFPLSRPLYMFTQGWPEGTTLKFIRFILNPDKGQKIVEKTGYIPLY